DGKGVGVLVRLPSTVSTAEVKKRRQKLAEACDRHEYELLITIPKAHHVYLWFANPGVLDEPIGPSPLVTSSVPIKASMEKGTAPWGETLKGDPVGVNLWQNMLLITGLSNQGKTRAMRALALWLAFDPHVHFWVANLKGVDGDWDMFQDLCDQGRFIKGPGVQHAIDTTFMVEAAWAEMERRLNSDRVDWDPLVVIIDEAQKAYMNPEKDEDGVPYGGQANNSRYTRAIREIHNQGRVVNVITWEGTQDPTNQNLSKITREGNHIRISLVVGTPEQAKMALGAAAVDGIGGGAPHLLRKDIDAGTVVMHGGKAPVPLGEKALTVRTHHIDDAEAWKVAGRALAKRRSRGGMPVIDAPVEKIDHLMNMRQAMRGEDVVRTVVILGRLMEDWPEIYEQWGSDDMSKVINAYAAVGHDIAVRKRQSGQSCLVLEELETALRERVEVLP
ncbi:MAG: ATP-binding protein, partial [Pseudonocardia sp.]|nr:ATP-binding protein [Pseudonocardia sp.]